MVNLFIISKLDLCSRDSNTNFALDECLFRALKLTKNADPDNYEYTSYGIGFDAHLQFSLPSGTWGKNVVISVVGSSLSAHANKPTNDEEPINGSVDTTIITETQYSVNSSNHGNEICLSLHYNTANIC